MILNVIQSLHSFEKVVACAFDVLVLIPKFHWHLYDLFSFIQLQQIVRNVQPTLCKNILISR